MFANLKKQHLIVIILMMSLLFGGGVSYGKYLARQASPPVSVSSGPVEGEIKDDKPAKPAEVMVHVSGAVKNPGVYTLKEGSRVIDAVKLASPVADADLNQINLAKILTDQEKIPVPLQGSAIAPATGSEVSGQSLPNQSSAAGPLININTAGEGELDALPGIGPAKAKAIVQYREENGNFTSIEDLQNVSGIGTATFDKLKDQITI